MRFTDFISWYALAELSLFFAAFALLVFSLRQRRYWSALPVLLLMAASYLLLQGVLAYLDDLYKHRPVGRFAGWLKALPPWVLLGTAVVTAAVLLAVFLRQWRLERSRITPMSVKEATDNLPSGLCFYLPGGRIVLVNRTMEELCRELTGGPLANGAAFRERLFAAQSEDDPADGSAWTVTETSSVFRGEEVRLLMAAEVTELYRKTLSLREMRKELAVLNERLTVYFREAADLTIQKEILEARIRLHDEMGEDLLMMQHCLLEGCTENDRLRLEARLRRSLTFLKSERVPAERDEYRLMFDTAARLGGRILVDGELPQNEPLKHILATALHECLTNTLRHAKGRELRVTLQQEGSFITARLCSDGIQPEGPIRVQGGLKTLRSLAEQIGGCMYVEYQPRFAVCLRLPKEDQHAIQSPDR